MPEIARFYGLIVSMHFRDREHPPPHIHIQYAGQEALMDISTLEIISGKLPKRAVALALEWVSQNRQELADMWKTQEMRKLPPLE